MDEKLWNAVKTYINYFGEGATITNKGLLLFLSDTLDLPSTKFYMCLNSVTRKLVKTKYLLKTDDNQFYINSVLKESDDFENILPLNS